jgi:2,4-dienoyl-CoA reductase-like NADH-dependent reductase (Old Yellow Enzyme family)
MSVPLLFTPLQIRSIILKNRVVLAPMHQYASNQGFATDRHLMNAGKYAAGGRGLVMVESPRSSAGAVALSATSAYGWMNSSPACSASPASSRRKVPRPSSRSVIPAERRASPGHGRASFP